MPSGMRPWVCRGFRRAKNTRLVAPVFTVRVESGEPTGPYFRESDPVKPTSKSMLVRNDSWPGSTGTGMLMGRLMVFVTLRAKSMSMTCGFTASRRTIAGGDPPPAGTGRRSRR